MSDTARTPKGVVAIYTNSRGDVMATGVGFDTSGPGGFPIHRTQERTARMEARKRLVEAYCSWVLSDVVDSFLAEKICDALCDKAGHKLTYRAIGWDEDIAKEIER